MQVMQLTSVVMQLTLLVVPGPEPLALSLYANPASVSAFSVLCIASPSLLVLTTILFDSHHPSASRVCALKVYKREGKGRDATTPDEVMSEVRNVGPTTPHQPHTNQW